jgi:hypothetical protein
MLGAIPIQSGRHKAEGNSAGTNLLGLLLRAHREGQATSAARLAKVRMEAPEAT